MVVSSLSDTRTRWTPFLAQDGPGPAFLCVRGTMRALDTALASSWAITEPWLETILEIASREHLAKFDLETFDKQAVAAQIGRPLDNTRAVTVRDGVAVLPIRGPIFRYANLFSDISGGTSVEMLSLDFTRAMNDPGVRAILLDVDSPGGAVAGISEFADRVYDARGTKPITAYVGDLGASAAYWIAAAADEVVVARTASVGSIGILATLRNNDSQKGKTFEFVSSQSPNKRVVPGTTQGDSQIQAHVDTVAAEFIDDIARYRGVTAAKVLSDFGQGDVLVGRKAVAAGMADRLGSYEQVLSELAKPPVVALRPAARAASMGDVFMPKQATKGFWKSLFAAADEYEAEQAETEQPQAEASPPAPVIPAPDTATQPQLATVQAELQRHQRAAQERITADATLFADAAVTAQRITPAERDQVMQAYIQAAQDDAAHPSEASRVAFVKWSIEQRPTHGLTTELLPQGQDAQALLNRDKTPGNGEQPVSDERRKELLATTHLGKQVLANQNGNGRAN